MANRLTVLSATTVFLLGGAVVATGLGLLVAVPWLIVAAVQRGASEPPVSDRGGVGKVPFYNALR